jgi:phage terminase large subunit
MEVRLSELIGGGFADSRAAVRSGAGELIELGGRGSGKSSYLSIELILQLLKHPGCHAVVVRKVANTLRTSVFTQLQWAAERLGILNRFRVCLSPLELEYLPTGQKILFFGMDDAGKLKSLKPAGGFVGLLWFEELDQFTQEEVRSCEQSVLRGGDFALTLKSFNPPADKHHWVNRLEEKPGRHFHRSTYLELPESWLGARFLQDAEHLRRVNPTLYDNEYLGLPVGEGAQVFQNLRLEGFEKCFDTTVCGIDWGWWPDPWVFVRVGFDSRENRLYILDELRKNKCGNAETAALVAGRIPTGTLLLADGAEPKSIADYRAFGLNCRSAPKGKGSRRYGIKWLQSLDAIVIDPAKCPETAREFAAWCYEDGQLPERDDHHIDAVRYACSRFWRRKPNAEFLSAPQAPL